LVGIFPNERSLLRLVGALLLEQNDERAVTRRYMSQKSLAEIHATEDQATSRPVLHPVAVPVH
jgi:transposase-like protein